MENARDLPPPCRAAVDCVYHWNMPTGHTLAAAACLALSAASAQIPTIRDAPITTFGVTVVDPFGLRGDIYLLRPDTDRLPKFEKLEPVGAVYTSALNVPPRDFRQGFPGVTNRFEWFAIDYTGNFYVSNPGKYRFLLASDDGSKLYIDNKRVIDNDGLHPIQYEEGSITLKGGIHRMRISYFQGPAAGIALILAVARPGEDWRIFSTNEFRPPRNPADWKYGDPNNLPRDEPAGKRKK
jgi:PA14 domain